MASRFDLSREVEWPVPEKPATKKGPATTSKADGGLAFPNLKNQKKKNTPRESMVSTPDTPATPASGILQNKKRKLSEVEQEDTPRDTGEESLASATPDNGEQDGGTPSYVHRFLLLLGSPARPEPGTNCSETCLSPMKQP